MDRIPGEFHSLLSADSLVDMDQDDVRLQDPAVRQDVETDRNLISMEELNSFCPPGFPDHELKLKIGTIAILIRNLDVRAGLVNGSRLRITSISNTLIKAEVLNGNEYIKGYEIVVQRIPFVGDVSDMIKMERLQFPLRPAFCMTYNKCQGQTLDKVIKKI
jgi:hypothetical protein